MWVSFTRNPHFYPWFAVTSISFCFPRALDSDRYLQIVFQVGGEERVTEPGVDTMRAHYLAPDSPHRTFGSGGDVIVIGSGRTETLNQAGGAPRRGFRVTSQEEKWDAPVLGWIRNCTAPVLLLTLRDPQEEDDQAWCRGSGVWKLSLQNQNTRSHSVSEGE